MSLKNASLGRILTQNGSPPVDSNISPFYSYFKLKSRNRGNILKTDDRPVLHDQRLLRNGNMPHPPRDGNIRTARFPVIGNEIFDGRLRAIRQIGDERGKTGGSVLRPPARPVRAFRRSAGRFPLPPLRSPSARQTAQTVQPCRAWTSAGGSEKRGVEDL